MTDRSKPPPGYSVIEDEEAHDPDVGLFGSAWYSNTDPSLTGQAHVTEAEAVAACWAHRDRVVADAAKADGVWDRINALAAKVDGSDGVKEAGVAALAGRDREQQALGIERAADGLAPEYDDYSFVTRRLRELAEKVRRGDA